MTQRFSRYGKLLSIPSELDRDVISVAPINELSTFTGSGRPEEDYAVTVRRGNYGGKLHVSSAPREGTTLQTFLEAHERLTEYVDDLSTYINTETPFRLHDDPMIPFRSPLIGMEDGELQFKTEVRLDESHPDVQQLAQDNHESVSESLQLLSIDDEVEIITANGRVVSGRVQFADHTDASYTISNRRIEQADSTFEIETDEGTTAIIEAKCHSHFNRN